VLTLDEMGYPDRFHYRDNQGFYLPESRYDRIDDHLPGVGERVGTVLDDLLTDVGFGYYVVRNNALGVINAFGCAGLVDETRLLASLRAELERARERYDHDESSMLDQLLSSETVPCKANLLTRIRGMDELEEAIENQSVYRNVANPIVTELDS
jgi:siderophore synthetase component